jgi:hypothetical protein
MSRSHVVSRDLGDLAAIFERNVELVSVARAPSAHVSSLARQLFVQRSDFRAQWIQANDGADRAAHHLSAFTAGFKTPEEPQGAALADEIDAAVEALSCLLGCSTVGVRLATLRRPMCPKFHVDRIPCRMLITFEGPGTEWIPHDRVDWAALKDHASSGEPLRPGCRYESLEGNAWSLLKGGDWDEAFEGVVHRSPQRPGNRLLISLDPVFAGG